MRGELAIELREQGDTIGEAMLCAGGGERGILRRGSTVDDEAPAGKRLKDRGERGVAHPVVRPSEPRPQRERRAGIKRDEAIEACAKLAARVGRGARIVSERKTAAIGVSLAVGGRAEALRLDRGIGRNPAVEGREAVAALDSAGDALRVEARGEMVAGKGEAVGRHPVIGVGEGAGEIGRGPS